MELCKRCNKEFDMVALYDNPGCLDWRCPLMAREMRMARAFALGDLADHLTAREARGVETMARRRAYG